METTTTNQDELLKLLTEPGSQPTLLYFYADWCGPCKAMKPIVNDLATDTTIYRLNVEENYVIGRHYEIRAIPTFVFVENGEERGRLVGAQTLDSLKALIDAP